MPLPCAFASSRIAAANSLLSLLMLEIYFTTFSPTFFTALEGKRVRGIEPPCAAWEAAVLPLNYTRGEILDFRFSISDWQAGNNHCHEITSSSLGPAGVAVFARFPPRPSLPKDQAITP